jgi:hypothetical protein
MSCMSRITISLQPDERAMLFSLANCERRDPRDQAVVLIRERLFELGLIASRPTVKTEAHHDATPT